MVSSAFSVQRQPPVVPSVTVVVASPGVPIGGASGTVLTKSTATDYDTSWITRAALAADAAFSALYLAVPTAWTAVTFTNSWVDFGAPFQVCQYRKVGDTVQLRGLMKTGAVPSQAFTLPVGFRPPADLSFACRSGGAYAGFTITSAGVLTAAEGVNTAFSIQCAFSTV